MTQYEVNMAIGDLGYSLQLGETSRTSSCSRYYALLALFQAGHTGQW